VSRATHAGDPLRLSLTEYAVLGLLTFGSASGYELSKLAGRSIDYFWRPAKSKIYAVLPRLVDQGLARTRSVEQQGRPDKNVYALTAAGRRALRRWLDHDAMPPAVARNGLLLKLFFGAHADGRKIRKALEDARDRAAVQLAELEGIEARVDTNEDFFPYLTLLYGIEDARSTVRWATTALDLLDRRRKQQSPRGPRLAATSRRKT
jgi:PadR family transcriptional regulator, regulatory protein AphA